MNKKFSNRKYEEDAAKEEYARIPHTEDSREVKTDNWNNKRFAPYSDETSGIGGRPRPTTYGVYDNKIDRCVVIHLSTFEEAVKQAREKNKDKRYSPLK